MIQDVLWTIIRWPAKVVSTLAELLLVAYSTWVRSLQWRWFVRGLPALILFTTCTYLMANASLRPKNTYVSTYVDRAKAAVRDGRFGEAKVYYERALDMIPNPDDELLFSLATASMETKDYQRAILLYDQLGPVDSPRNFGAHLWQAERRLKTEPPSLNDLQVAETHLLHALKLKPTDQRTRYLLGELSMSLGKPIHAVRYLKDLTNNFPEAKLNLAKAYLLTGDVASATRVGREALEYLKIKSEESKDPQARIRRADAHMFLEEFPEAVRVLESVLEEQNDLKTRVALARVHVSWADSLDDVDRQRKFELLSRGLLYYAEDFQLFDRLMRLLQGPSDVADTTQRFLLDNLTQGKAVGMSHLLLGTSAFVKQDAEQARSHLERAFETLPQAPIVANNLAWLMNFQEPARPERALLLIEPVVERYPQIGRFHDTRGHIYVKLGRWKEAVADLEFALRELNGSSATHAALAEAWEHLGDQDLADEHRRLSKTRPPTKAPKN